MFVYLFVFYSGTISVRLSVPVQTLEKKNRSKKKNIDSLRFYLKAYLLTEKQLAYKYFIINNENHLMWPVYSTTDEHSKRPPI